MQESFGARLRAQRLERQIELSDIAEQTKIRVSLLEGLERDDLSQWPGGIFRRSYVRTYARAIGLDPDAVVREFLEVHPEHTDENVTSVLAAARGIAPASRPRTRVELMLGSALGALPVRRPPPEPAAVSTGAATVAQVSGPVTPPPEAPVREEPAPESAAPPPLDPVLEQLADQCARLASAANAEDVADVVAEMAGTIDAAGVILWAWDPDQDALLAAIAYGYPPQVLSDLPRVHRADDNPVAAAFRTIDTHIVDGSGSNGAIVVPMVNAYGCVGVLALELRAGAERSPLVRVIATILSAQLATLVWPVSNVRAATA
jgi:hypothetical protein